MSAGNYFLLNNDSIVVGKIIYDPDGTWKIPDNHSIQEAIDNVEIGYIWDGSSYIKPEKIEFPDDAKSLVHIDVAKDLLQKCDWIGLVDVRKKLDPENLVEWDSYRASLREFIINPSPEDPWDINEPEVIWA